MISIPAILVIDRLNPRFPDAEPIPPAGFELSPSRDEDMIVWKKAIIPRTKVNFDSSFYEYVVKLKIPKDAAILFTPTKCRANRAIVLGFYPCAYGGEECELNITSAMSWYNHQFIYNLGEEIFPDCFNPDWRKTCSNGIHFFRTFDEAVNYVF